VRGENRNLEGTRVAQIDYIGRRTAWQDTSGERSPVTGETRGAGEKEGETGLVRRPPWFLRLRVTDALILLIGDVARARGSRHFIVNESIRPLPNCHKMRLT
jgi:hypothetical protein